MSNEEQRSRTDGRQPVGTVVFDFDGTISLGDGPVRSYARHAFARLPAGLRERAVRTLDL